MSTLSELTAFNILWRTLREASLMPDDIQTRAKHACSAPLVYLDGMRPELLARIHQLKELDIEAEPQAALGQAWDLLYALDLASTEA